MFSFDDFLTSSEFLQTKKTSFKNSEPWYDWCSMKIYKFFFEIGVNLRQNVSFCKHFSRAGKKWRKHN